MRILIYPSSFNTLNLGDVAMLQVAVRRLRALVPRASIRVFTEDPEGLQRHCPEVQPFEWRDGVWFGGPLTRLRFRQVWNAFRDSLRQSDLLVISGAGGLTDHAHWWSKRALRLVEWAAKFGKPAVFFSLGLGPLTHPDLIAQARLALPRARLIALREARTGPLLAQSLGVAPSCIVVTGDDAVEMAYETRADGLDSGLGVNLRVSRSAAIDWAWVERIRPVLETLAHLHAAPLLPLPISLHSGDSNDPEVLRALIGDQAQDAIDRVRTPLDVIRQAAACRVVVTGAYHAAVFALSQGIPAVCLTRSAYFSTKFFGLAGMFPEGCSVLQLDQEGFEERLTAAVEASWSEAERLRAPLLEAAAKQVELGRAAYRRALSFFSLCAASC
jgi:polysaccharide pyruvyl transferase WcaK-like protein